MSLEKYRHFIAEEEPHLNCPKKKNFTLLTSLQKVVIPLKKGIHAFLTI
jgi:hypothetical protein